MKFIIYGKHFVYIKLSRHLLMKQNHTDIFKFFYRNSIASMDWVLLSSMYLSVCFMFSFLSAYCLSVHIRICRRISYDIPDIPWRGRKGIGGLRRGRLSSSLVQSFQFIIPVPLARFTCHRGVCILGSSNLLVLRC